MKTEFEIEKKINEIETERKSLLDDYKKTSDVNEQSIIAERNMGCHEQIQLLKWVLNV